MGERGTRPTRRNTKQERDKKAKIAIAKEKSIENETKVLASPRVCTGTLRLTKNRDPKEFAGLRLYRSGSAKRQEAVTEIKKEIEEKFKGTGKWRECCG